MIAQAFPSASHASDEVGREADVLWVRGSFGLGVDCLRELSAPVCWGAVGHSTRLSCRLLVVFRLLDGDSRSSILVCRFQKKYSARKFPVKVIVALLDLMQHGFLPSLFVTFVSVLFFMRAVLKVIADD